MTHTRAAALLPLLLLPISSLLCRFLTDADPDSSLDYFLIEAVASTFIRMSGKVCSPIPAGLLLVSVRIWKWVLFVIVSLPQVPTPQPLGALSQL